jgi:hypothetical protein
MEDLLTHETFSKHINTKFQTQLDETNYVDLELAQVSELKLLPEQQEFTIVFRGPSEIFLGQGIRSFTHEQMGQFEMFIVPIAQDEEGFSYEAVFNRISPREVAG